ncbi:MAG: protein kinase, partial [Candidatus Margulisbacteria bacterium]|nr:protein kinase [Candidatus Margulisiibacteriota bacterium]
MRELAKRPNIFDIRNWHANLPQTSKTPRKKLTRDDVKRANIREFGRTIEWFLGLEPEAFSVQNREQTFRFLEIRLNCGGALGERLSFALTLADRRGLSGPALRRKIINELDKHLQEINDAPAEKDFYFGENDVHHKFHAAIYKDKTYREEQVRAVLGNGLFNIEPGRARLDEYFNLLNGLSSQDTISQGSKLIWLMSATTLSMVVEDLDIKEAIGVSGRMMAVGLKFIDKPLTPVARKELTRALIAGLKEVKARRDAISAVPSPPDFVLQNQLPLADLLNPKPPEPVLAPAPEKPSVDAEELAEVSWAEIEVPPSAVPPPLPQAAIEALLRAKEKPRAEVETAVSAEPLKVALARLSFGERVVELAFRSVLGLLRRVTPSRRQEPERLAKLPERQLKILGNSSLGVKQLAGKIAGRFEIVEKIGEGGLAIVYLCQDLRHEGRMVAVKVMKVVGENVEGYKEINAGAEKALECEIEAMLRLPEADQHNLVNALAVGGNFLVLEYIENKSSFDDFIMSRKDMSEREYLDKGLGYIDKLLKALGYMHKQGLMHGDVSPNNFFIQKDGIKTFDLGSGALSQWLREIGSDQLIGTPSFISPEQANADAIEVVDDLYSVGLLLYTIVTGRKPFAEVVGEKKGWRLYPQICVRDEILHRKRVTNDSDNQDVWGLPRLSMQMAQKIFGDSWSEYFTEVSEFKYSKSLFQRKGVSVMELEAVKRFSEEDQERLRLSLMPYDQADLSSIFPSNSSQEARVRNELYGLLYGLTGQGASEKYDTVEKIRQEIGSIRARIKA